MNELLKKIDVVIFDLGEVLIDLDYPRVIEGFSKVAKRNREEIKELVTTASVLQAFEVGELTPSEFRDQINRLLDAQLTAVAFDAIWNSMLKSVSKSRFELLAHLRDRFQTYILSNTNAIHEVAFNQMMEETIGKSGLQDCVAHSYLSHQIGLRKPNADCFEYVIADIGNDPSKMLFLDDRLDNVMGALASGMKALQITNADLQLNEIFRVE